MNADQVDLLCQRAAAWGVFLDEQATGKLGRFFDLLTAWNRRIRLTGERDQQRIVAQHGVDSVAAVRYLPATGLTIDVGSGGGFPGIILACARPELELVLLDARRRSVSFLREATRSIPLPRATALHMRAEDAAHDRSLACRAQVVIARGIRLDVFLPLAQPLLAPGGIAIAMQTPRIRDTASVIGQGFGLRLAEVFDYHLAGGEPRSLLVFESTPSHEPVS
jgi:16S rRNA (guanine527-N7)-methyltransferase